MKKALAAALLALSLAGRVWALSSGPLILSVDGRLSSHFKVLHKGEALRMNASVRLARGARAVLRVPGGAVLVTGPAVFVPKLDGFILKLGGMLSVLPHLHDQTWRVSTPAAVAAVRGTEFYIEADTRDETYLCLCRGAVDVTPSNRASAPPIQLRSTHHTPFNFRLSGRSLTRTPAPMRGHTDAEILALRRQADSD